jgi:hypothetical protein
MIITYYRKGGAEKFPFFICYNVMEYEFYAEYGDVTTTTPWKRPTLISVSDWWKEFSFEVGVEDYDIWMVGSFAERTMGIYTGFPNDFDVVMTGDIQNYKKLKQVMDKAVEIGFEKRILVDIMWTDSITNVYNVPFRPYGIIRNTNSFTKTMNGEVMIQNFTADEIIPLAGGLYHLMWYEPSNAWRKVKNRMDEGIYAGVVINAREFFE